MNKCYKRVLADIDAELKDLYKKHQDCKAKDDITNSVMYHELHVNMSMVRMSLIYLENKRGKK